MSENYYLVKSYYDKGLWSKERVKEAVRSRWITIREYKRITGEDYSD